MTSHRILSVSVVVAQRGCQRQACQADLVRTKLSLLRTHDRRAAAGAQGANMIAATSWWHSEAIIAPQLRLQRSEAGGRLMRIVRGGRLIRSVRPQLITQIERKALQDQPSVWLEGASYPLNAPVSYIQVKPDIVVLISVLVLRVC